MQTFLVLLTLGMIMTLAAMLTRDIPAAVVRQRDVRSKVRR
jgi:hypothetical protein